MKISNAFLIEYYDYISTEYPTLECKLRHVTIDRTRNSWKLKNDQEKRIELMNPKYRSKSKWRDWWSFYFFFFFFFFFVFSSLFLLHHSFLKFLFFYFFWGFLFLFVLDGGARLAVGLSRWLMTGSAASPQLTLAVPAGERLLIKDGRLSLGPVFGGSSMEIFTSDSSWNSLRDSVGALSQEYHELPTGLVLYFQFSFAWALIQISKPSSDRHLLFDLINHWPILMFHGWFSYLDLLGLIQCNRICSVHQNIH